MCKEHPYEHMFSVFACHIMLTMLLDRNMDNSASLLMACFLQNMIYVDDPSFVILECFNLVGPRIGWCRIPKSGPLVDCVQLVFYLREPCHPVTNLSMNLTNCCWKHVWFMDTTVSTAHQNYPHVAWVCLKIR